MAMLFYITTPFWTTIINFDYYYAYLITQVSPPEICVKFRFTEN